MTCHPNTLDFAKYIREKKIVLVDLSGKAIRNEVGSLGAIFMTAFYLASESLDSQLGNLPPRCYLYIDELAQFITSPLDEILSQSRKYGLSLTCANQYLDQVKDTLPGIFGNVGTHFMFELSDDDAKTLSPKTEPEVTKPQLLNLGAYRMAVKTRAGGKTLPAFIAKTRPIPKAAGQPMTFTDAPPVNGVWTVEKLWAWKKERYSSDIDEPEISEKREQPNKQLPESGVDGNDGLVDYENDQQA